jgi:hypothetical protein
VVGYESAHVDYVTSELVAQRLFPAWMSATIEEVRRILHEHLNFFHDFP